MIEMTTSGNRQVYQHPWVYVPEVEKSIDYGWYSHFVHTVVAKDLVIMRWSVPTRLQVTGSPQRCLYDKCSAGMSEIGVTTAHNFSKLPEYRVHINSSAKWSDAWVLLKATIINILLGIIMAPAWI